MVKNYLLIALRNLRKNKSYVIINTLGLGIALACCITAYLLLAYNIEFDNFHSAEKVDKIYRMHATHVRPSGEKYQTIVSPVNLPRQAMLEITGLNKYTRYIDEGGYVSNEDDSYNENITFVDDTFFEMFDFPLMHGNHDSFKDLYSVFISEATARKYFADSNPVGKVLKMSFVNDTELNVIIGGVLKEFSLNNTFNFNFLVRMEHFHTIHNIPNDDWSQWRSPTVFFEVASHEQVPIINDQLDKYIERRNKEKTDQVIADYRLEHFLSNFNDEDIEWSQIQTRISIVPLVVFVTMGVMILLIACFNMTNTSIALTAKRMKEVGVRKVIGAGKWQIVSQFLIETVTVISLAIITGLAMAQLIVPAFADMWRLNYGMEDLDSLNLFVTLLILLFFASLLAGMYPALFSSKFQPVTLLKGSVKVQGTNFLTRSLITVQFAISVIVLVAGVLFIQNTKYQEKIDFGYDQENVFTVKIQGEQQYKILESKVSQHPKIKEYGVSNHHVGWSSYSVPVVVDTTKYQVRHFAVGNNYFEVMGLDIAEGRTLNLDNTTDVESGVVVNQAFVDHIGMEDPLNKVIVVHDIKRHIVGVLENHLDNLFRTHEPEPSVFYPGRKEEYQLMLFKTAESDLVAMKDYMEEKWKEEFPELPYEARFQEDMLFEDMRSTSRNLEQIFLFLTVLGAMLSASGIFALASLNIEKRSKEIGIRKALGASVNNILNLMNREFVYILSIAGLLGSLGGYFLTTALLNEIYAFHMEVGPLPILASAMVIILVGISTTSATIFRAAKANPVDTLRDE